MCERKITEAKKRFRLPDETGVVSCYEAGQDGFGIHRHLLSIEVQNIVVDSSSIEVNRRRRRAKTDRIDVRKLYTMLVRHDRGGKGVWGVVRVPSREDEDDDGCIGSGSGCRRSAGCTAIESDCFWQLRGWW